MANIFLSYSHKDKEFVQIFNEALKQSNHNIWVDWIYIQEFTDWWEAVKAGIEATDTFIFIITPTSIISEVCNQEIEYAAKYNKKIIPIVLREIFDKQQAHPALLKQKWLVLGEDNDILSTIKSISKD